MKTRQSLMYGVFAVILALAFIACSEPESPPNDPPTPVTLSSISLNTSSVKKAYTQNETLNLSGLIVTAHYSDSTSKAVTNYTANPANGSTLSTTGDITVTISYTEGGITKSDSFTVNVNAGGNSNQELADEFTTEHEDILAKTVDNVALSDEAAVDAALADYEELSAEVKALLTAEKAKLDSLKEKIDELKADATPEELAEGFTEGYEDILAKTVDNITIEDETEVDRALAAYEDLSSEVKGKLTAEKTKLDNLKSKIQTLKETAALQAQANDFKTTHATALAKTVGNITTGDENAVNAALSAYNDLSAEVKALLTAEKTLLDNLKDKIDELKAATYGITLDISGGLHTFTAETVGYTTQETLTVTVTNSGNQATGNLTVALSGANSGSFTLSTMPISSIAVGSYGQFTVTPVTGLAANDYTATVTVTGNNGITASFNVSFTVIDDPNTITNTQQWNAAIAQIQATPTGDYTLNIDGAFGVAGTTTATFGTTAAGSTLTVTLKGNGRIYLTSQGNLIRTSANQTVILDSEDLTLQGLTNGQNDAIEDNNTPVVFIFGGASNGTFELRKGTISGNTNTATVGGGVMNTIGGIFIMTGGTISGNTTNLSGGGVNNGGTRFTMSGGTISGNTATNTNLTGGGGGVYSSANFTMSDGTISGNFATNNIGSNFGDGGGVYVSSNRFTMTGGTISGNTSSGGGAGVYIYSTDDGIVFGTFNMIGGTISGNTAGSGVDGGGVLMNPNATFRIENGTIYGREEGALSNNGNSGSAFFRGTYPGGKDAERGTFSIPGDITSTWTAKGIITNTPDTIKVANGEIVP